MGYQRRVHGDSHQIAMAMRGAILLLSFLAVAAIDATESAEAVHLGEEVVQTLDDDAEEEKGDKIQQAMTTIVMMKAVRARCKSLQVVDQAKCEAVGQEMFKVGLAAADKASLGEDESVGRRGGAGAGVVSAAK